MRVIDTAELEFPSRPVSDQLGFFRVQLFYFYATTYSDLVVRVPGYRPRGPDSIPGATRFLEM
jgi:hypothetical protein